MAKLTLNTIGSRYGSIDALNANFDAIETALENTLSRDGTLPNNMDANLNMDSNRIINLADGINNSDAVTLRQVNGIIAGASSGLIASLRENFVATAGQTVFNIASFTYNPGSNNLAVYLDGVRQYPGTSYTETDNNTITFSAGLHVGALVMLISNESVDTANLQASAVHYTPAGTGAVATNVQIKLRETVSVRDFGAVGDGVTDDTAAIQAAINGLGANGGTVWFPVGEYLVSAAITFSTPASFAVPVLLKGDGAYATTITASHSGVVFDCRTDNFQALMMENIRIVGPGKTATGSIAIDGAFAYGYLDRVSISLFETGIKCSGSNLVRMRQLNIINCTNGVYGVNAAPTSNILFLDQSWISYCDYAVKIQQFGTATIRQTYTEQNGTSLYIRSTGNVRLEDIYSEAETFYGLYGYDIYPVMFNCRWVTNNPYLDFSAPPPLYGQTTSDGLRLGSSVNWGYNYNSTTKNYDVAFTDFVYGGKKYRCIGQTTSTSDAYDVINASGYVNHPKQPLAIAKLSGATSNDKTGDGTVYTVIFDSETVDQSSSYDPTTGIFTTPVAGKYQIDATISLANIDAAHTFAQMDLLCGATHYYSEINPAAIKTSTNKASMVMSNCVSVGSGVAIKVTIDVLNGTKTIGIGASSYLSIRLVA